MVKTIRNENNIIAKKEALQLLNALGRKIKNIDRKLMKIGLGKTAKIQYISKNELNQDEKLQKKKIIKKNQQMN